VRNDISLSAGPQSVSELSVVVAKQVFDNLEKVKLLLIGAGETTKLVAYHFKASGVKEIIIVNRNEKNGRKLAKSISADYINLHNLDEVLIDCDIVVSATRSRDYLINRAQVESIMIDRKDLLLLLDISTPRNIDPSISDIDSVSLYDLDHLDTIHNQNTQKIEKLLVKAELLIHNHSLKAMDWFKSKFLVEAESGLIKERA
jgi:glutamyl-tRNA reductase